MVDKIKITNHSNNHSNKNQILPAYKKLLDYNENINNSDLCNSYTRFLTELELLNNAISEAKNSKDDNTVEVLTKRKEYVQYTLKEMGSQNINMCTDTTSVQSALLSSLGISSTQANMQNLNQSVNIEQNENNAQISFKSKEKLQKNNESTKQIYLQLFDSAITYYEEQLVCDLDRKQDFLDELKKDKENLTQINVDDIDKNILKNLTKNYILDGYKKDNMALLNQLFEEKDEYNDFRFTGSSIFKILSAITPENKDIFNILLDSKDENNNFMFDEDTICDLLSTVTPENIDVLFSLLNAKDNAGNFRFNIYEISDLLSKLNTDNKNIIPKLLEAKDENDDFRIDINDIYDLIPIITRDNQDVFISLFESKDKKGNFRFNICEISNFLSKLKPENKDIFNKLLEAKDDNDNFRFSTNDINNILQIASENKETFYILLEAKDENDNLRFDASSIYYILLQITPDNMDIFNELLGIKDDNGFFMYNGFEIASLLTEIKPENRELFEKLYKEKDKNGNYRFNASSISYIVSHMKPEYTDILYSLIEAKDENGNLRFDSSNISKFIYNLNNENKDIIPFLLEAKDNDGNLRFNYLDIDSFLEKINSKYSVALFKELCNAQNKDGNYTFDGKDISILLQNLYPSNLKFFDKLFNAKNENGNYIFDGKTITYLINNYVKMKQKTTNINNMTFFDKVELYPILTKMKSHLENISGVEQELAQINSILDILNKELNQTIMPTDVTKEAQANMMSGFFANNNPNLENLIATTDFSQFGENGLPLEYSRAEFLRDLTQVLKNLSQTEQADILKKLGITPAQDGLENGFDGIINVNSENLELDLNNPIEAKVYQLASKFIRENSVVTGNQELDEALNSLIKGMPEFINIIGKKHHLPHKYCVDVHILKVLQEAMANKNYQNLSNLDKTILKFSVILHDISKPEGIEDPEHPIVSALYARNILGKYSLPVNMRDRIFELIKNHHWLKLYNNININADHAATMFRHKDDFTIAQIMSEADLKGVSESFYDEHKEALNKLDPIEASLDKINQTGQIVFTSKIIKPNLIPTQDYNGQSYQVINFSQLPNDFDLSQYGFAPGTTPDSLRLYVHMTKTQKNLEIVNTLSDVANGGFLCASYISLADKSTYNSQMRRIGVSLEAENVNIANAGEENQESGLGENKNFQTLRDIITGSSELSRYRQIIPTTIKRELGLTDEEYKLFYEQFAKLQYETQIQDDREYTIGSKTIKGSDIKAAIHKANDNLIIFKKKDKHNESNLYNPKINAVVAKYDSLEELAQYYPDILDFAQQHNLPIYLLGE